MRISSLLWLLALVVLGFGSTGVLAAGFTVDFETEPHPDLSEICNLYIGEAEYVYAFLVIIKGDGCGQETSAFGFDVGYKLICPDGSVVNRGFTRLPHWETRPPPRSPATRKAGARRLPLLLDTGHLSSKRVSNLELNSS